MTFDLHQVDYAIDVYKQLSSEEDSPEPQGTLLFYNVFMISTLLHTSHAHTTHITYTYLDVIECRREVVEKLHEFEQTIDPIVQLFEDPEVQEYIENRK